MDMVFPSTEDWKSDASARGRSLALQGHLENSYGGPWRFNEVIGHIRLNFLGSQIRGEYFGVSAKRVLRTRKKLFLYKTHKLAPEVSLPFKASNNQIWDAVQEYIEDCRSELRGRYVDAELLSTIGPHIDWQKIAFENR
ncbi:MAG: hypothetical protein H0U98_03185 [Alphaproteobacteria bacterium]|nr:hypothetical protein [Alphaproteobacteria bacterium]